METERLTTRALPALEALEHGRISARAARAIANEIGQALGAREFEPAEQACAAHIAERAAVYAESHTSTETARRTKQLLAAVDLQAAERRHAAEMAQRNATAEYGANGVGWYTFSGRSDQIMRIEHIVDAAARTDFDRACEDDNRTLAQTRADLCVELFLAAGATPAESEGYGVPLALLPAPAEDLLDAEARLDGGDTLVPLFQGELARPGVRPTQIKITFDWESFISLRDRPGMLDGGIPLPASVVRELIATSEFRRLILDDPTGELLDLSPMTYRIPQRLDEFCREREPVCIIPGCSRPASRCDLDHREPFDPVDPARGGKTVRRNLAPLCRRHHLLKTHHGFELRELDDASLQWITPRGRIYVIRPHDHRLPAA